MNGGWAGAARYAPKRSTSAERFGAPRRFTPRPYVVDYETEAIEARPQYPPKPVGVSIMCPGQRPKYWAWGHPNQNNCSKEEAQRVLKYIWRSGAPVLFHHAQFDLEVGEVHMGLPRLDWRRVLCSQILAFLLEPERKRIALKELVQELLGVEPKTRDELRDWILSNVPDARQKKSRWGAYICRAPGRLVGRYAEDDTRYPLMLLDLFMGHRYWGLVTKDGGPFDRERRMIYVQLDSGKRGFPIGWRQLEKDLPGYKGAVDLADVKIRKMLGAKTLDVDSKPDLALALHKAGKLDEEKIVYTAKTQEISTAKDALEEAVQDKHLLTLLRYRSLMATNVRTFFSTWLEVASQNNGWLPVLWASTKQIGTDGKGQIGARTGRQSSSPNLQNVPKKPPSIEKLILQLTKQKKLLASQRSWLSGLPPIPNARAYIIAPRGLLFGTCDFSQQELRILAHFEEGILQAAYRKDPKLDMHLFVTLLINELTGGDYNRDSQIKPFNFGKIYGQGIKLTAKKMGVEYEVAAAISKAHKKALPGVQAVIDGLKDKDRKGDPFLTWGGRPYHCEEPTVLDEEQGIVATWEYKMLNTLIQGSAADHTKEAELRYYDDSEREGDLLGSVHDELPFIAPSKVAKRELIRLKNHMESVEFSVPMLAEGAVGRSWADVK